MIRQQPDPLGPGQMVGEFEVGTLLAAGGMGIVYSAIHPIIGKRAAIKVLHPGLCDHAESIDRFLTEARSVNRIGHPNIVDVFAFGTLSDGRSYMVMEWLAGESLAQRLVRGPYGVEETLAVLDQTADALEAAHEKGIVHRDLKPDNIFLVPVRGGRTLVKLLDFGIAKLVEAPEGKSLQTTLPGSIMGTPGYLSPEQARGLAVDGRTDVYALGCVAFEMLAGRTPFDCDNTADMIVAHLEQPPPHVRAVVPKVPLALDAIITRMLDKDQAKRPSLIEVRAACRPKPEEPEVSGEAIASIEPVTLPTEIVTAVPRSRRSLLLAGLAAAVTVIIGLLVILGNSSDESRDADVPATTAASVPASTAATPAAAPAPPPVPAPAALPTVGELVVSVQPAAQIVVDGKIVSAQAVRHELRIDAGMHEVVLSAPGHAPAVKSVRVNPGAETELSVELALIPKASASPPSSLPAKPRKNAPAKPAASPNDYMLDPFPKE